MAFVHWWRKEGSLHQLLTEGPLIIIIIIIIITKKRRKFLVTFPKGPLKFESSFIGSKFYKSTPQSSLCLSLVSNFRFNSVSLISDSIPSLSNSAHFQSYANSVLGIKYFPLPLIYFLFNLSSVLN